jgi:hypothetical protein
MLSDDTIICKQGTVCMYVQYKNVLWDMPAASADI